MVYSMMIPRELVMANIWDCPLCGQSVEIGAGLPPNYFDTCRLRDHMIGDECIAYRDPERARRLLLEEREE
jgi:hypothetical protein